jgi:hypothetical protein
MFSKDKLLELNSQGFIPGPKESEKDFFDRIQLYKDFYVNPENHIVNPVFSLKDRMPKPYLSWTKSTLINLYGFVPQFLSVFFDNKGLNPLQGAVTWECKTKNNNIIIPVLQLKKGLKKGSYLGIYKIDEILAHEAVHAARIAFQEPKFEEVFAYLVSDSIFRKVLGPIIKTPKELIFFFLSFSGYIVTNFLVNFFQKATFFFHFFAFSTFLLISYGLFRLVKVRKIFNKTLKKLISIFSSKSLALSTMLRLTDSEIILFSKMNKKEILSYAKQMEDKQLRWKVIFLAYFHKIDEKYL